VATQSLNKDAAKEMQN